MLNKHFVRSTDNDNTYSFGPKVSLKYFNLNETVTLTITEFITPTIFFAYESAIDCTTDRHINMLYDSLSEPMRFTGIPQIGTTCVGKFSVDNRWYRARVIDRNNDKMTVDLLFIDYGNIERSVHFSNIRKLEGTLSTQFSSFMDCSKLNSQAALFGFIGNKACDSSEPWKDKVKDLEMKCSFDFQVISIPNKKSNMKNQYNTNVPFYLIKNNVFNKDPSTKFETFLINELKWEKCDVQESLSFLIRSFIARNQSFKNIQILLPHLLLEYADKFNPKPESLHSLEDDNDDDGIVCVTPPHSETDDSRDNENGEGSISSLNRNNRDGDDDVIVIDDDDYVSNNVQSGNKVAAVNVDRVTDPNDDEEMVSCSVAVWKTTNVHVNYPTHSLPWLIPVPEEQSFKAIITSLNEQLEFYINVCSEDVTTTFKNLETLLLKHFILCNDSMLKHYVTSNLQFSQGTVCLCSLKSTYYRCVIVAIASPDDVECILIDFGDKIVLPKTDFIPISDQFCQVPPLAIRCTLAGLGGISDGHYMDLAIERFHKIVEEVDYEVLVSICVQDKLANFKRLDDRLVIEQPVPVEIFTVQSSDDSDQSVTSVNAILMSMIGLDRDKTVSSTVVRVDLESNGTSDIDDLNSGMKDIFINENLHQQTNMRFQDGKRRVCDYFRNKGRCFKGSKCQDRHVMDSDESDNDDESQDWKMMEKMHYLDENFERELIIGSFIGVRVSAIYTTGIFYAYLTHDINGFIEDGQTYYDDEDIDNQDGDDGLEFKSIQDMEAHLKEALKFQQVDIDKRFDLPVNTMVAVAEDDMVHRGSIRRMVSDTRYQVFLVDYGVPVEASVSSLSLLPRKYSTKFRQQCFLCKLAGVKVLGNESRRFADWFYERVNRKVLHCRVVDMDQERTNYVELYNFNESGLDPDINGDAKKLFSSV